MEEKVLMHNSTEQVKYCLKGLQMICVEKYSVKRKNES